MKKRVCICAILAIIVVFYSFLSFYRPGYIQSKYIAGESFYDDIIKEKSGGMSESSVKGLVVSYFANRYMEYMGYYTVEFFYDGTVVVSDHISKITKEYSYRISPIGVVYINNFRPFGLVLDSGYELLTRYGTRLVKLKKDNDETGWESYKKTTERLKDTL